MICVTDVDGKIFLLIVPEGIEMRDVCVVQFVLDRLLIVPEGIEICKFCGKLLFKAAFNRTRRN